MPAMTPSSRPGSLRQRQKTGRGSPDPPQVRNDRLVSMPISSGTPGVPQKSVDPLLDLSHGGRPRPHSLNPPQVQLRRGYQIHAPDERGVLALNAHWPQLVKGQRRVKAAAGVVLNVSDLVTVTRRSGIRGAKVKGRLPFGIEHLPVQIGGERTSSAANPGCRDQRTELRTYLAMIFHQTIRIVGN